MFKKRVTWCPSSMGMLTPMYSLLYGLVLLSMSVVDRDWFVLNHSDGI